MAYPSKYGKYMLQLDAAQGDSRKAGGMGVVLLQAQQDGTKRPVGFVSRQLYVYEQNYPPFLL